MKIVMLESVLGRIIIRVEGSIVKVAQVEVSWCKVDEGHEVGGQEQSQGCLFSKQSSRSGAECHVSATRSVFERELRSFLFLPSHQPSQATMSSTTPQTSGFQAPADIHEHANELKIWIQQFLTQNRQLGRGTTVVLKEALVSINFC